MIENVAAGDRANCAGAGDEARDPRRRRQPADAARRAPARDAPRRGPVRRGRDARRGRRRAAAAQRQRPQGQHDAARRGRQRRGRDPRRRRRVRGDPRPHRRRGAAGQRRAEADPPRAQLRRGARAREHRRARRACGRRSATSSGSTWRSRRSSTRRCACSGRSARRGTTTSAPSSSRTSTAPRGDLEELLPLEPNLRFVKGAYLEPEAVAYPEKSDVDAAYARLVERSLTAGGFTAIATHDEALIDHAKSFADDNDVPRTRFQFQMLYGVRPQLQLDLVRERLRRPRRDAVRAGLVPLPDAPPRRAAGERALHRTEPAAGVGGAGARSRPHLRLPLGARRHVRARAALRARRRGRERQVDRHDSAVDAARVCGAGADARGRLARGAAAVSTSRRTWTAGRSSSTRSRPRR